MAASIPDQVRDALRIVSQHAWDRGRQDVAAECDRFANAIDDQAAAKLRNLLR